MPWLIIAKFLINWGLAVHYLRSSPPAALLFFGVGLADLGTLWLCLSVLK